MFLFLFSLVLCSTSVAGIDAAEIGCIYSPAKRRGPVPGKSGQPRKAGEAFAQVNNSAGGANGGDITMDVDWNQQQQQHQSPMVASSSADMAQQVQQMLGTASGRMTLIQKLQQQVMGTSGTGDIPVHQDDSDEGHHRGQRLRREPGTADASEPGSVPKTIASHTHLLEGSDVDGNRLRAYYRLSIDELYRLPLTPADDEYCAKYNASNPGSAVMTPTTIPGPHLAALSASRFAEVALGAVVHQEISLAIELCNAVVHCLRECLSEPVQDSYMYEVTRAHFLLGVFRAYRGDMERYFKYRRVAMTYAANLPVCAD
jgi:hypothetical protein